MPRYSIAASTRVSGSSISPSRASPPRWPSTVSRASERSLTATALRTSACAASAATSSSDGPKPVEGELRLLGLGGVLELAAQVPDGEVAEVERPLPRHRQVGGERGVADHAGQLPAPRPDRQQRALDLVHDLGRRGVGQPGGQRLLVGDVQVGTEVDERGVVVGGGQREAGQLAGAPPPRAAEDHAGTPGAGVRVQPLPQRAGRHVVDGRRRSRPRPRARRWSAWRTAGRAAPGTAGCRRACAPRCGPRRWTARSPGPSSSGTARSSSVSRRFCSTDDRCSRSFSPTLPLTVSTWSTSASSEPYSRIHLAAVFSPTLGMLGRLSLGSPRSAAKSGYCAGDRPYLASTSAGREPGQVGDALARVQHGHVLVDQLQGVAVTGADQHVHALLDGLHGERGDDVVGLVALGGDHRARAARRAPPG